jgi:antirestriction protein
MSEERTATRNNGGARPRIYVASLADYNAGRLHGTWIDADRPAHEIRAKVARMLAASREPMAEEWAVHDYQGFPGCRLSESSDFDYVSEVAGLIAALRWGSERDDAVI